MTDPQTSLLARRMIIGILSLVGLVSIVFVLLSTPQKKQAVTQSHVARVEPIKRPASPDDGYVGSDACASCHAEIAERYKHNPMSRSMCSVLQTLEPHEDYTRNASFKRGGYEYRVERHSDKVIHHELLSDDEGLLYDQPEEIQYALGSGTRGRSYLMWRDGVMLISPIGWYAQEGWDLNPGYTPGRHPRFSRRAVAACLLCHAGRVSIDPEQPNQFPQPVFHEQSISCERCHGPGQAHVDFRRGEHPADVPDPIIHPGELSPAARDAVCYQCHLQGVERITRYGRTDADYRPGNMMGDIWTIFSNGTRVKGTSTAVVSQAQQMQSSRCYQESPSKLSCLSCHDAHAVPDKDSRDDFYKVRCLNCHANKPCSLDIDQQNSAPANGSCIQCHMPSLQARVVPHTSQTDHRIPRRPAASKSADPVARQRQQDTADDFTIFEEEGVQLSKAERDRARGLMLIRLSEGPQDRRKAAMCYELLSSVQPVMPDDDQILEALGAATMIMGERDAAEQYWRELLSIAPRHENALARLANSAHESGRYDEARELYAQLLSVNPTLAAARGRYAHVLGQTGRLDQAIQEARRALELDPTQIRIYGWLSEAYAAQGDKGQSEHFRQLDERMSRKLSR